MATLASTPAERMSRERKFYSRMAFLMLAIIFVGFMPSFYLRGLVHYPRPNPTLPPAVMLHGLAFTAWLLIFVAQTQFVAAGRRDLHIQLGQAAFLLGVALIPIMYLTAVWQVARANQNPFTDPLNWTIVPLSGIIPFAIILWLGWTRRREAQWHKRAMLVAMLLIMQPGIGRLPLGPPGLLHHVGAGVLTLALFIPLMIWDRRTIGQLHPVTKLGFALEVMVFVAQTAFLATGSWAPIAAHLPGVGA